MSDQAEPLSDEQLRDMEHFYANREPPYGDVRRLLAEVRRLKDGYNLGWTLGMTAGLEEAAKVAAEFPVHTVEHTNYRRKIAAAIRALKEKQP